MMTEAVSPLAPGVPVRLLHRHDSIHTRSEEETKCIVPNSLNQVKYILLYNKGLPLFFLLLILKPFTLKLHYLGQEIWNNTLLFWDIGAHTRGINSSAVNLE